MPAETDIPRQAPSVTEVAIVVYPSAQLSAIHGWTDLFVLATAVARVHGSVRPGSIRVTHWQANAASGAVQRVFDTGPEANSEPAYVLVPSSLIEPPGSDVATLLGAWLRSRHDVGAVVASVCLGAFILGEVGLLAGRRATTHWALRQTFADRFPTVMIDTDRLIVEDGGVITAGGLLAWVDLGLNIVTRVLGPSVAVLTARYLLFDAAGREQRNYSNFRPRLQHGDAAVFAVQEHLDGAGSEAISVEEMAALARLEPRTFFRRFRRATGLTPIAYYQLVRINRAREILSSTRKTIKNVAWDVGYADVAAFARVFRRVTGLSPSDYRRRFGVDGAPAEGEPPRTLLGSGVGAG
ncbi:MAG: helix-turn-helix domain-containing protein [Bauldia sp.]|nr:helix-turn-helix domain-containing protein [Bauldia sp.]